MKALYRKILRMRILHLRISVFYDHGGVDWFRTLSSAVKYHFKQGGSTLTQQLIKNLTGENGKTVNRKFYEILSALNLEKNASKQTILEAYMNTVYMSTAVMAYRLPPKSISKKMCRTLILLSVRLWRQ